MSDFQWIAPGPGFYHISEHEYRGDPCPEPSLNHSMLKLLQARSPYHVWRSHPRLDGSAPRESTKAMEFGSLVHEILFGAGKQVAMLDFKDFRTKEAKDARAAAEAEGKIVVRPGEYAAAMAVASSVRPRLPTYDAERDGEVTMIWQHAGFWFRAMVDLIVDGELFDLKTSSAPIRNFERTVAQWRYDTQAAFYSWGYHCLTGMWPKFTFVAVESDSPFAVQQFSLHPDWLEHAHQRNEIGIGTWMTCLESNTWPGYADGVTTLRKPKWLDFANESEEL